MCLTTISTAAEGTKPSRTERGDRMIATYFENETRRLADACLADVKSWDDWAERQDVYHQQLLEMLGLDPLPERTPLNATITGKIEHDEFTVEKLHFQSRPRLYVTGNLYLPKKQSGPAPAVLYVCGHSSAKKNGVSYGNKTKYQHHGAWFARNGYVCLVIDTLQLGEIAGIHHGTYRENMWWWNARGYTPGGVEAWNSIRALDYLQSRPEVDKDRLGVSGRSGGGAYSWYLAALDDRIKCAVPVAGITNLKNHVVDGCVEGHCDCMYFVNTYRWDYPQLAAMVAPRALLLANSDQDRIFPLDGIWDVHEKVRPIYEFAKKRNNLGLNITVGPHEDTQVLQLHAFQWFNHHLKNDDAVIHDVAESYFEPEQLKVFDTLPTDQINTTVHETFVPMAVSEVPATERDWQTQKAGWMSALREKCFAGWPAEPTQPGASLKLHKALEVEANGLTLMAYDFESQPDVTLRLFLLLPTNQKANDVSSWKLEVLDDAGWKRFSAAFGEQLNADVAEETPPKDEGDELARLAKLTEAGYGLAFIAPRGIGTTAWTRNSKERLHIKRRFMLLGQTLDGMRVWDVRRAVQALSNVGGPGETLIEVKADGEMAGIALYASLFQPQVKALDLRNLSASHREGPNFLNVLRYLDVPQAVAMAADGREIRITTEEPDDWKFATAVAEKFGLDGLKLNETSAGR